MRKRQFKMVGVSATVLMTALATVPAGLVFAAPPVYRSNEYDDTMITRIIPAESYIEMTYAPTGKRAEKQTPGFINLQFGGLTDAMLHSIGTGSYGMMHQQILGVGGSGISGAPLVNGQVLSFGQAWMNPGVELLNNEMKMIDYVVQYDAGGEEQRSRADYRRCVDSSVFISGEATECRMERIGGGRIQYQPYTAEGLRVTIPADEDAILTEMTESWRAEPGDWGPEWYDDEGDNSGEAGSDDHGSETGADDGDDTGGGAGVDGGDDDAGADDGNGSSAGDSGSAGDGEVNGEQENNTEENGNGNEQNEIEDGAGNNDKGTSGETSEGTGDTTQTNAGSTSVADNAEVANGNSEMVVGETTANDLTSWYWVAADNSVTNDVSDANEVDMKQSEDENVGFVESALAGEVTESDEVGVPNLGKETGDQPNWTAIIVICVASVAGLVGWAIWFFGKHLTKKERR